MPRNGEVMGLRERREQRRQERETFGRRGNARQYLMRQKLLSFGDDYWIEDDAGKRVLRVDGKALRLRHTLDIEDDRGAKVCRIQTRVLHLRNSMAIENAAGEQRALVHKALISPLRERWKVDLADDREWRMQGNVVDHEYEIGTTAARSPRSPSGGSGCATPTAWRSHPTRTRSSSWQWPSRSTR
jgi:uncharacterized protein YxjI